MRMIDGPPCDAPKGGGWQARRDGKPSETMGRKARGCRTVAFAKRGPVLRSFGCIVVPTPLDGELANHWKQWDAKPEAKARDSALSPFGCMANRGKPRDAKPEAKGPLRLFGGSKLVRLPDTFASE